MNKINSLFDKISLRKKLFITPVILFILLILLWIIFYNFIKSQNSMLKDISENEIYSIREINQFFTDISTNHSNIQSLLLDNSSKNIEKKSSEIIKKLNKLDKRYKKLKASMKSDIKSYFEENIDKIFNNYIVSSKEAIKISALDNSLSNFYIFTSNGNYAILNSDFKNLISNIEKDIQIDIERASKKMNSNFNIFILISITSISLIAYFIFGLSQHLSSELNEILESIKALSNEELNKEVPKYQKGDDFYQISIALEKLRIELQEKQKAEMKLRLNAKVFENTAEMIIVTDKNNRIIDVNKAFSKITGYSKEEVIGKNPNIIQSGYQDKNFYKNLWKSVIKNGYWQGEIWDRKKNGALIANLLTISTIKDGEDYYYIGVAADITKLKESQERAEFLAFHDTLTNLPNRVLFLDRLEHAIKKSIRNESKLAILFIDLDQFKNINDTLGHPVGDILLQEIAQRLKKTVRPEDTIARLGGDEFVILIENVKDETLLATIANRILKELSKPVLLESKESIITCSIGISIYPNDGVDGDILIQNADTAMYAAKAEGRNNYQFYRKDLTIIAKEKFALENDLRKVLSRNELTLKYQPQVDTMEHKMMGVEALVRWKHNSKGFISPELFIRLAEEIGMINDIGKWVFREACKQTKIWQDKGMNNFRVAVNLSVKQLMNPNLVKDFKNILEEIGIEAETIELEVTESYIMEHIEKCIDTLYKLKEMGFTLAIDDFGTGYSSLSYLKKLPIKRLKVDKSFVMDIYKDSDDMAIAKTILAMGKSLGLEVIAEGVEEEEQLNFLMQQGCEEVQGYYFSKPLMPDELEEWYRKKYTNIKKNENS